VIDFKEESWQVDRGDPTRLSGELQLRHVSLVYKYIRRIYEKNILEILVKV